ncbi:MAG: DUF342 domain-containing protein [Lachnospiraceae bacterium]|jgi:hypothetical protein|nr:DUF342 domain-containing protein [Lachnospiraceae bacterium]
MQYTDQYNNLIDLGEEDMEATIYLRAKPDGNPYTIDDLKELLRQAGVKHGVKEELLSRIASENLTDRAIVVAEGKPPVDGKDGDFEFLFRTKIDSTPKVMEDGSVDYLDVDLFEKVEEGQLIARYHKATGGAMGYTVRGKILLPKKGKDKPALRGKGFHMSEDAEEYFSDLDGKIEFKNGQIYVSNVFEVSGDLDVKFGNIDFNGDVLVTGAVRSGMHIKAGGNVTINGVVEGAIIEAGGDILLKSGVLGNNECEITTKGNVIGKFFENAKVVASGTVNCNYLMNSDVTGHMGVIVSGKRSTIIGGVTRAQAYVKATNIGNASEVSTIVRVGADDETITKIRELRKQIHALTEQIEVFEKNLHVENDQHEKIVLALCMKINERLALSKELQENEEKMKLAETAYVRIDGTIYPKVAIRIDLANILISKEVSKVTFRRKDNLVAAYQNTGQA